MERFDDLPWPAPIPVDLVQNAIERSLMTHCLLFDPHQRRCFCCSSQREWDQTRARLRIAANRHHRPETKEDDVLLVIVGPGPDTPHLEIAPPVAQNAARLEPTALTGAGGGQGPSPKMSVPDTGRTDD